MTAPAPSVNVPAAKRGGMTSCSVYLGTPTGLSVPPGSGAASAFAESASAVTMNSDLMRAIFPPLIDALLDASRRDGHDDPRPSGRATRPAIATLEPAAWRRHPR